MTPKTGTVRFRYWRAYWVTIVVISSYLSARIFSVVLGPKYLEKALMKRHGKNARRIERTILQLQGLFIKVGQLFSIMTNFLPPEFRNQLEGMQDNVPPRPYSDIKKRIIEEFGKDPQELFSTIEETPIASASLGQVHIAHLHDGEKVAVKVQYPDIDVTARRDLKTLKMIIKITGLFFPYSGMENAYNQISQMILEELDFEAEANNIIRIGENFHNNPLITIPHVFGEYSNRRVLTTRYIEGIKSTDLKRLKAAGINPREVARQLIHIYCQQIFIDGIYHADPHPGNIFVINEGPKLALIDFGAVATVSPTMRNGMITLLQGVINQNTDKIVSAMKEMGFISRKGSEETFDKVVKYFHEKFQESIRLDDFNLKDIQFDPDEGFAHLIELKRMDIGFRELTEAFYVPKEWILLERTLLLLTGLCTHLDEDIKPMEYILPYLNRFVLGEEGDWSKFLLDAVKDIGVEFLSIPSLYKKFLNHAYNGKLDIQSQSVLEGSQMLYALGHQLIYTMFAISGGIMTVVLELHSNFELAFYAKLTSGTSLVLLFLSMFKVRRKRKSH